MPEEKKQKPLHQDHRARMQERVRRDGLDSLAPHEVLEYLLFFSIPRKDTNALAHLLIQHFGSYGNVLDASEAELLKVEGIGPASARLIVSIRQFERYYLLERRAERRRPLRTVEDCIEYARPLFHGEKNEQFYLIAMDDRYMPLRDIKISDGTPNHVTINTRKMARDTVSTGCSCALLAHNHPMGLAVPSQNDIVSTRRVAQALGSIGVQVVDHIIVTPQDACSMVQSGRMPIGSLGGAAGYNFASPSADRADGHDAPDPAATPEKPGR